MCGEPVRWRSEWPEGVRKVLGGHKLPGPDCQ